jgi:hypothetical protein
MCSSLVRLLGLFAIGLPLAVAGCGAGRITYPVSGSVRFDDGEPVRFGVIEFRPIGGGTPARAKLDNSGKFILGTVESDDGAAEGSYQVIIVQHFNPPPPSRTTRMPAEHEAHDRAAQPDVRVAAQYADYASSPLRATVQRDLQNSFEFVVSRHSNPNRPPGQLEK